MDKYDHTGFFVFFDHSVSQGRLYECTTRGIRICISLSIQVLIARGGHDHQRKTSLPATDVISAPIELVFPPSNSNIRSCDATVQCQFITPSRIAPYLSFAQFMVAKAMTNGGTTYKTWCLNRRKVLKMAACTQPAIGRCLFGERA